MFCFCYKGPFEVLFLLSPQNSTSKQYQNNLVTERAYLSQPIFALTPPKQALAARGLEELFFQLCCSVSFWFLREIGFGFIYYVLMYLEYNTVVVLCQFLVLAGNSFWCYVFTQCTIQLYGCVSFLVVAGNSSQNENPFFHKKILLGYFIMIRQPMSVFHKA